MTPDRSALDRLRAQARQARADGHFTQAARLERQAVELAGMLGLVGERTRALLWEGYSLWQAGEEDLALAALLQAANDRAASADPADVFAALVAVTRISLERKTAAFCRALLEQGRRFLADIRRPWAASLDFLEGDLAYRRGDFAAAWDWHTRAWAGWRDQHPRLTAATHLWALCRVAFRRRDPAELERLSERLTELHLTQPLERQLAQRARLLCWRARRATGCADPDSDTASVEIARSLLLEYASHQYRDYGVRLEALRVMMLSAFWNEIADAVSLYPLNADCFDSALLLGDFALSRLRLALGLPAVDDDYGEKKALADPFAGSPARSEIAVIYDDMKRHYHVATAFSKKQDSRLETEWYSDEISRRNL